MGFKHNDKCLEKAGDDEPIFVLRAQDVSAPAVIRVWLTINSKLSDEKRMEAETTITAMQQWKMRKEAD